MKVSNIFLIVFLYLYVYNPVFVWPGFGFVAVVSVVAALYCIYLRNRTIIYLRHYKTEFILSVLMTIYVLFITASKNQDNYDITKRMCSWVLFSFVTPIYVIEMVFTGMSCNKFFNAIIYTGVVAAIISFLCMVFPMINEFIKSIQSSVELKNFDSESARHYGLAVNLTSAYGYVQGTLAALCILISNGKRRYFVFSLLLTLSAAINARTGLFPVMIAIAYKMFITINSCNLKKNIRIIMALLLSIVVVKMFTILFPHNAEFIVDFFNQLNNIILREEISAYEYMLFLPSDINGIIFGEGRSLFTNEKGDSTDIGYVNQIFIGGVVFALSLIIYVSILYWKIWKRSNKSFFPILLFVSALIFNYKGSAFYVGNAFTRFVYLYYFYLIYNRRCEIKSSFKMLEQESKKTKKQL